MRKIVYTLLVVVLMNFRSYSQNDSKTKHFSIAKKLSLSLDPLNDKWKPVLQNKELPKPDDGADQKLVKEVKRKMELNYRNKRNHAFNRERAQTAIPPVMLRNFTANAFNNFVPNDNDMAISNNEVICGVTNTIIWSKDLLNNTIHGSYTLHSLTDTLGLTQEEFDPKILYDPGSNRFIFVCLNGFSDSTSNIIVGFSESDSTWGNWNFYALPGNPLNDTLWTDFPMIAVTDNELFITVNLLYNDSNWQTGFNESLIWQINKHDGYNGNSLNSLLHHNIDFNGKPIRNLCPVKGGSGLYGPNMYFLSNRNFAVSNDTIFLVEITDTIGAFGQQVNITPLVSNTAYHMPVDADQPFVDHLIVNDARILGAFFENNNIQFVLSSLDTSSGYDGIYHGVITDVTNSPVTTAAVYVSTPLDVAYPNIAYAGTGAGDNRAIIGMLQSSATMAPGSGAILFDGINSWSPITTIKTGTGYCNMLSGDERWGDYTGCQTKYNQPELVWMAGSYTITNHTTRTWMAELSSNPTASPVNEITDSENETQLFPNPVNDITSIDFNNKSAGWITIEILGADGKIIKQLFKGSIAEGKNNFSFQTSSLSNGIYFLKISNSERETIEVKKFVKE